MTVSKKDILYLSVILLLISAVFYTMLDNYFLRDETAMIRNIHDFSSVLNLFIGFRLIPALLFKVVYVISGTNPLGYNALNFLLHLSNTVLLYFFTSFILTNDNKTRNQEAGLLSALYFSVCFSHHEGVYYIPGISDLVATFFCLLCLLYFIFYSRKPRIYWLALSVLFYGLFLLSKPTGALFPFCLLALAYFNKISLRAVIPYFIICAVYLFLPWTEKGDIFSSYFQRGEFFSFLVVTGYYMLDLFLSLAGFTSSAFWFEVPYGYLSFFASVPVLKILHGMLLVCVILCLLVIFFSRRVFQWNSAGNKRHCQLLIFLFMCMVFIFLPQSFLPELYPIRNMYLIQYRYLYLPACFFSIAVSMGVMGLYGKLKNKYPVHSFCVSLLFAVMISLNAYETFMFGKSMDFYSAYARKSVDQILRGFPLNENKKFVMAVNAKPLIEAYYKTCITDMVAIMSQERVQMVWVHQNEEVKSLLSENHGNVYFYMANGDGFFNVTQQVQKKFQKK